MKLPKINLDELKSDKEENSRKRLKFIDMYVEWLKKTSNKEWSRQQKELVD